MGELSRLTVVGTVRRVDVAVPASTPIGEYVARLARMCGQERDPMLPPAWSLAPAGGPPLSLADSLADAGVDDGQVLYLRDTAGEPGPAPMVEDLDELVANETVAVRRRMVRLGPVAIVLGLAWLLAAAGYLALRVPGAPAGTGLALTGSLLVGVAWSVWQRGAAVPRPLRLAMALAPVACLAVAGDLMAVVVAGTSARWVGIVLGANAAVLMALASVADPVIAAVAVQVSGVTAVWLLTSYAQATRLQTLTVAVLVSVGFIPLARRIAAAMAAWGSRTTRRRHSAAVDAVDLVHQSAHLLATLLVVPALTLAAGLPMLAVSGHVFALGLAAVVSAGLLARAFLAGFGVELCVLAVAGLAGGFGVVVALLRLTAASPTAQVLLLVGTALAIVGGGVAASLYGPADPTAPSTTRPPRRRTRAEVLAAVSSIATIPLAMGVFGVFGRLIEFGRHLF